VAFAFLYDNGFEGGVHGATAESGPITFPSYRELARFGMAPYRGAYCAKVALTGGTTSGFIREDTAFDAAADDTDRLRFYFYLGSDFTMADSDKFSLFEAESTLNTTTEVALGIDRSGANIRVWVAETAAAAAQTMTIGTLNAPGHPNSCLGKWYAAEVVYNVDAGGGNDGTIDAYLDGVQIGSQITGLDQGTIVDAKFGVIGPDAGTSGTVLIDEIRLDDARVYPFNERFPQVFQVCKNEHIFVGPGWVESAGLLSSTSTNTMILWDTDRADTNDTQGFKVELNNAIHSSVEGPIYFAKGCYAVLNEATSRGQVAMVISRDSPVTGIFGPKYYSQRGMIMWGSRTA